MQFKNYDRKIVSYEKQMQIAENKAKVEMTLDPIRAYLQGVNIFNVETDSLYKQISSVVDLSSRSNYFIDQREGPQTEAQKKMMYNIERISDYAQEGIKMHFIVDMEKKKYLSAAKDEGIGTCLCCLHPVNAANSIMLLTEEDQRLGMYAYVGTPSKEGVAYLFAKEAAGSFFIQLQEFHFLSLKKTRYITTTTACSSAIILSGGGKISPSVSYSKKIRIWFGNCLILSGIQRSPWSCLTAIE